jgi:nucleoside 2-deoxyribosyltransferase
MSTKIKRVYVAGLLTPRGTWSKNLAIDALINQRKMIRASLDAYFAGFDPFVPAFDHAFWMVMNDGEVITEAMIKRYSKSWLEVCDAVLLTPKWRNSPGTLAEIKHARELGIPVYETLEDLIYAKKQNEIQESV